MRMSKLFVPTRKEDPADAEVISHKLLLRAGYIRMIARGIYSLLPLGWRSVRKIEQIIREEMDRAGAQEILMPGVQPAELWQESGRWEAYGAELLRFRDRKGSEFALGPTHEEVVTDIIRHDISSYKQLPLNVYQIQSKFRDETRPRFGLMRGREFIMKDAYSFDVDPERARESYQVMYEAYHRIFERLGFDFRAVEADTGNIGGDLSHEFQVLAETGEDKLVSCPDCGYAANVEKAQMRRPEASQSDAALLELETVETPGARTIAQVSEHMGVGAEQIVKTLVYVADGKTFLVLMRGDHDVNEVKLKALLSGPEFGWNCTALELAADAVVEALTKAPVGFAGPVYLKDIVIVADEAVMGMSNFIVGANRKNKHLKHVNAGRDFEVAKFADLREAAAGDLCGRCGGVFEAHRGIEVGHVFYLGTKYSEAMGAKLQGEDGQLRPIEMGCYGIGVTRILAAAIEQRHDDDGMILPLSIAPYHAIVLPLQLKDDDVVATSERLYQELKDAGVEVVLDDRDQRPGAKFKDADLIGIPLRISVGSRGLKDGQVEYKRRGEGDVELVAVDEIVAQVVALVKGAK